MGDYQKNTDQQGDVLMYQGTEDRGEINEDGGIIEMTRIFETMSYLVLFGGNEDDDGSQATEKKQWWGNEGESEERQYRGKFQALLNGTPITSASVRTLEAAALDDLKAAFVPLYAAAITVSLALITPKYIKVEIFIELHNAESVPITLEVAA